VSDGASRMAEWFESQVAQRGLTLRRIETEAGVSHQTLQKVLAGEPVQRRDRLAALAQYLGYRGDAFELIARGNEPVLEGSGAGQGPGETTDYNSRIARMPDHVRRAVDAIIDAEERALQEKGGNR
jgi:transcriptional regulator with XRE-family HTH domain